MTKFFLATILSFLLISFSCTKKKVLSDDCESLSMRSFKGSPQALNKFNKKCVKQDIIYTKEKCQTALIDLIKSGNLSHVQKIHGERVKGCFTENDLSTFSKK